MRNRHPLYETWSSMKKRCYNKNCAIYKHYGGRGVIVCDEWLNNFQQFVKDVSPKPYNTSLDRIDNDGNYEPSNVRWATRKEQSRNKRNNRFLEFQEKRLTINDWANELGIKRQLISDRINKLGWSVEKTLSTPARAHKDYEYN